ncbi:ABC-2 type transporter [Anaeromyxobacter dehalogenans 2CP-1]|uniref:ABC-2 type transporter n=1 Tax=Anaeromyxobacter dehalogenans (strain ATCC BAA-258 / DSM 21875 / 2CP-1) TaxID=455488 RepID=B8JHD1_ANAD2|nr:ABC transporter permease [Anaeromyxobacter dehalogenans]ACL66643.1 ABC-2 type transporter [Anaeromyxobacter dehalogenans 2CP-1]
MTPRRPRPSARVQFLAVFRKEVRQTARDKRMMAVLVIAPLLQTVVFGFAANFDVDRVRTVVLDRDRTDVSREHARRLLADGTLIRAGDTASAVEAELRVHRGEAAAAVMFPERLAADLAAGRPAEVQVLIDGADPNRSTVAADAVARYFGGVGERLAREALAARGATPPGQLALVPRLFYNPGLDSPPYMVPGIAALLLVVVTTIVSAMGLAREREMGTLEQVLVTPIRPAVLLAGKIAPYVIIGFVNLALLVGVASLIFGVPIRGPLPVLALGTLLYLLTTLGVGLFISTISKNQQQSFLGGFLFLVPALLLSGVMTPVAAMPGWLRAITFVNPVRHFATVMRGSLLRGAGLADLAIPLTALAVIGSAIFVLSALRFRKTLS